MKIIAHPRKRPAVVALLSVLLALGPTAAAETAPSSPNPFAGNQGAPTDRSDFVEENDVLDDSIENFGFEPPTKAGPPSASQPPETAPTPPTRPNIAPTVPSPRSATAPRPRTAFPPRGAERGKPGQDQKQPQKLADYLSLDPAVKGLQVKNFDLPDRDIRDVVTLISKWTGKNFILDQKVRGKITILGPSQVTLQEAYHAFLSALEANGLTTVQAGKFIRIIESAEARRAPVETYMGDYAPDTDQFITRIFQLKYINADEVQREFRDLTTRQGKLFAYTPTNSIIITDTGSNIRRIEQMLQALDVKGFETSLHVLRLKHTSSKQIADMLEKIYGEEGGSRSGSRARSTFYRTSMERTRGGGIISKIIPDEATNSLIVLANESGFLQMAQLVAKLDVRVTDTGRIHVYYCEYAKAEDLASTLASLATGSSGAKKSSSRSSVVGGPPGAPVGGTSPVISTGPVSAELGENVKVTSDAATNALVITASASDYQTLKKVIRKLDIPRLQVFVETAILEVTLDTLRELGTNFVASANGRAFVGGSVTSSESIMNIFSGGIPDGASIPFFAGKEVRATVAGQTVNLRNFMGILSFLTKTTNTSVLSTPQIIALDNEQAEFKVVDEIPVQATFTAGTGTAGLTGAATGTIERLKTGITIKLTPHVNAASQTVRLEIAQKVDTVKANTAVPSALSNVQRATTSRETNTNVVVGHGDFVMLGGLMSDKVDEIVTKVPFLGDLPILGWLFKGKKSSVIKTNLIILLHPRIIGTSLDGANLIQEKLEKRAEFIGKNTGGNDEYASDVNEMKEKIEKQKEEGAKKPVIDYKNVEEEEEAVPEKAGREKEKASAATGEGKTEASKPRAAVTPKAPEQSKPKAVKEPKGTDYELDSPEKDSLGLPPESDLQALPESKPAPSQALAPPTQPQQPVSPSLTPPEEPSPGEPENAPLLLPNGTIDDLDAPVPEGG